MLYQYDFFYLQCMVISKYCNIVGLICTRNPFDTTCHVEFVDSTLYYIFDSGVWSKFVWKFNERKSKQETPHLTMKPKIIIIKKKNKKNPPKQTSIYRKQTNSHMNKKLNQTKTKESAIAYIFFPKRLVKIYITQT